LDDNKKKVFLEKNRKELLRNCKIFLIGDIVYGKVEKELSVKRLMRK
jgi:hypothetical protein